MAIKNPVPSLPNPFEQTLSQRYRQVTICTYLPCLWTCQPPQTVRGSHSQVLTTELLLPSVVLGRALSASIPPFQLTAINPTFPVLDSTAVMRKTGAAHGGRLSPHSEARGQWLSFNRRPCRPGDRHSHHLSRDVNVTSDGAADPCLDASHVRCLARHLQSPTPPSLVQKHSTVLA